MSSNKRQLINKYFDFQELDFSVSKKLAKYGIGILLLGILLLYLQQIDVIGNFIIISTIFILVGLFSFWILIKPFIAKSGIFISQAEDGDMDVWFLEDMHEVIKPRALEQLSINPSSLKEENIIIIPFPVYWECSGISKENIKRKQGEDGSFIYTAWQVQVLIVTENFISYYSCTYDWLNSNITDERTNEYFFDDIASVRNDIIPTEYKFIDNEEAKIGNAKVFMLANMSGDKLTIITDIPSLNVPEGYSNNLERLVQAIRMLLRNRRYGEEIEVPDKVEKDEEGIEFEIDNKTEDKSKAYFHQQLRELYNEYNQDTEDDE
ncbi:MAG: hypothetical protein L3J35_04935 [Bacteroidales bacterium]|nr:hypothetical protein [Bacteroidales bacterium]